MGQVPGGGIVTARLRSVPQSPAKDAPKDEFADLVREQLEWSFRALSLRKWMYQTDDQLQVAGLNPHEVALVRTWQESKEVPYGLKVAVEQVEAYVKGMGAGTAGGTPLNASDQEGGVSLPKKKPDDRPGVVVNVEPSER